MDRSDYKILEECIIMSKKAKVILFDIENSPITSYTWAMFDTNVIDIKKDWELLSFSYKELGQKKATCITRLDFVDPTDKSLTKALWDVLNGADILIAHNANEFDVKKANAKFLEWKLGPVSPSHVIDTLKIARRYFKLSSNKLDELGKILKVGRKVKHEGFSLWLKCMASDEKAFKKMARYNNEDVQLLERVYLKLRPWMQAHPNLGQIEQEFSSCPKCKSTKLVKRGFGYTKTTTYQRYFCTSCKGWCKGATIKGLKPEFTGV